jgi:hypothetical protein
VEHRHHLKNLKKNRKVYIGLQKEREKMRLKLKFKLKPGLKLNRVLGALKRVQELSDTPDQAEKE